MPVFGTRSREALATCHPDLQLVADMAIRFVDFSVLEGHRNQEKQDAAVAAGNSQIRWPGSKHNKVPALAFDFVPYPIDWSGTAANLSRFTLVSGVLLVCAQIVGVKLRFGWDWNRNLDPRGETFLDWGHVELDV